MSRLRPGYRVLLLIALPAALFLAACSSTAPPTASSNVVLTETRVQVAGGSYINIGAAQLRQMLAAKDFVFINVHVPYEGEIDKTDAFIDYREIGQKIKEVAPDPNQKVVLYCRSGNMSTQASQTLVKMGYANVWNLDGGMIAWQQAGLPLIEKK